jgi:four helix bundle protein
MMIASYRDLTAWQKAMDLVVAIYKATDGFPESERYGLTSQLRRAVVSVPSNIAEGPGRRSTKELLHHLSVAAGSLCEAKTQIHIAQRLEYLASAQADHLPAAMDEVGRLIHSFAKALSTRTPHP